MATKTSAKKKSKKKTTGKKKVAKKLKSGETIDFKEVEDDIPGNIFPITFWKIKKGQFTTVADYLKTGISAHSFDGDPLLVAGITLYVLHDNRLHSCGYWSCERISWDGIREGWSSNSEDFCGLLVPSNKRGYKFFLIAQADDDTDLIDMGKEPHHCSLSINCLSELLDADYNSRRSSSPNEQQIDDLFNGTTKIVDYTHDQTRKPTAKVLATIKKHKNNMDKARKEIASPEAGFTLVGLSGASAKWHRSGTVLCSHKGKSYIVGQDEDMYFGCELVDNPTTVAAAFLSLMPLAARKKSGVMRHGEWFVVPNNKVPAITECLAEFTELDLPRDHVDSAVHRIECCNDGRISKDGGIIFVQGGTLRHMEEDHEDISIPESWFSLHRNTAVRSVSTEGVD